MSDDKFVIGPLQEKWLKTMEEHPERQAYGSLGEITRSKEGTLDVRACCLGQALICIREEEGISMEDQVGRIRDTDPNDKNMTAGDYLNYSYAKIGLRTMQGNSIETLRDCKTLAGMNDNTRSKITWRDIAAFIREKPERVFTRSV